jgi:SAM-dependent methyltransferase
MKNNWSFAHLNSVSSCDICGGGNIISLFQPTNVMKCLDCGFVFASPRPSLDDIRSSYSDSSFYDGWLREESGRLKMWTKRANRIDAFTKKPCKILDYSAGIGTFLSVLKQRSYEVFGTELSGSAIQTADKNYGIRLEPESFFDTLKYESYFDLITAWHVVEHVESPRNLLNRFYKWLVPRGRLVIGVPNVNYRHPKSNWFSPDWPALFPPLVPGGEIHLSHFSIGTLRRLVRSAGFRVIELGIDDYSPSPNLRARLLYWVYSGIFKCSGHNFGPTILLVAEKTELG